MQPVSSSFKGNFFDSAFIIPSANTIVGGGSTRRKCTSLGRLSTRYQPSKVHVIYHTIKHRIGNTDSFNQVEVEKFKKKKEISPAM